MAQALVLLQLVRVLIKDVSQGSETVGDRNTLCGLSTCDHPLGEHNPLQLVRFLFSFIFVRIFPRSWLNLFLPFVSSSLFVIFFPYFCCEYLFLLSHRFPLFGLATNIDINFTLFLVIGASVLLFFAVFIGKPILIRFAILGHACFLFERLFIFFHRGCLGSASTSSNPTASPERFQLSF